MELADETFAASCQIKVGRGIGLRFRKRNGFSRGFRTGHAGAMFMSRRDRGPIDDETEQQNR